jgi:hypothetical protein
MDFVHASLMTYDLAIVIDWTSERSIAGSDGGCGHHRMMMSGIVGVIDVDGSRIPIAIAMVIVIVIVFVRVVVSVSGIVEPPTTTTMMMMMMLMLMMMTMMMMTLMFHLPSFHRTHVSSD